MWIILVLPLLSVVKDIAGEIDCDKHFFDQCQRPKLFDEIPNEIEVFTASCPGILAYIKCVKDFDMKCQEEDKRRFSQEQKYDDLYALFDGMCKEGTALNKVVTTQLKCFNETLSNTNCEQERKGFLKPYETEIQLDEFRTTHVIPERVYCLSQILLVNCIVDDITRNCGLRPRLLTVELLRRYGFVDISCPLSYREGLLEDLDEFNLTENQKTFAIYELERLRILYDV